MGKSEKTGFTHGERAKEAVLEKGRIWKGRLEKKPPQLKWSMAVVLVVGWLLPLIVLVLAVMNYISVNFYRQIMENIERSSDNAVQVCEMKIESAIRGSRSASYIPTIKDAWKQYKNALNEYELQQRGGEYLDTNGLWLHQEVTTFLDQMYKYDTNLLGTFLYFREDEREKVYNTSGQNDANYESMRAFLQPETRAEIESLAEKIDTQIGWAIIDDRLYMVRNLMTGSYEPYGVIVMDVNREALFRSFEGIAWYLDYDISIDGQWIKQSEWTQNLTPERLAAEAGNTSIYHERGDSAYVSCMRKGGNHDISYAVLLNFDDIHYEKVSVRYISLLMIGFTIPLVLIVFYFLYRTVTKPVKGLIDAASEIEKGHFGVQITRREKSQEFAYLNNAFNSMSDTLNNQFKQIYLEELALKDANIMALQSQINPHFLNNTLEIINWEARMGGNTRVSNMIEALSTMMEATMDRKKQPMIPLSEELSYVDAYCYIIKQRFDEKFQFEKRIDQTLMRVEVPRLIIQPIIENAVEHGLAGRSGKVAMHIYSKDDKLYIEVYNDGLMSLQDKDRVEELLSDKSQSAVNHSVSLGICNVNKRLRIIYGPDCGLTIKNADADRTVSTITVKLHK